MMAANSERKENGRNGLIDIYRLLMAVIIMIFHSYHLYEIKQTRSCMEEYLLKRFLL